MERLILKSFYTLFLLLALSMPALAEETYTYSPEGCSFKGEFPITPNFARRCPSDTTQPCFEVAQYTERTEQNQVISIEMSCTPLTQELYDTYSPESMKIIALKMAEDANLPEQPPVSFQEFDGGVKVAGIGGLKKSGYEDKIFISQVWVHPDSIMTIEGEMSLGESDDADQKFTTIMRSISLKKNTEDQAAATPEE